MGKTTKLGLALLVVLCLLLVLAPMAWAKQPKADTVLVNGKIITVDDADSIAQAVAIKDGKIIAVGTRQQIRPYIVARTKIIDLHGRTATPGMIDSHIHFNGTDALYVLDLSILQVSDIPDIQAKVAAQCELLGPGDDKWVQGRGWAADHLTENRLLLASDLDPVSPNNPVILTETSYHLCVVNSKAMKLAGITAATPNPPGGVIDRDANGNPTGILRESAMGLVSSLVPPFTDEQLREGTRYITKMANSVGLTAIENPGIDDSTWSAFKDVLAEGNLTVRSAMLWWSPDTVQGAQALIDKIKPITHPYNKDNDMLWSQGVKEFIDGAQDADSHWSWQEHWVDFKTVSPGNYGYPTQDPDVYRQKVILYHNAGLHVNTHAIGDRAIDWTVGSYKLAEEGKPIYGLRHGIIHCDIPTDWAMETIPEMQRDYDAAIVYTNPDFMWWTEKIASTMGPTLSLREMPMKTWAADGVIYGFGTDWGVDPMDPKYSIWSAITRQTLMGLYGPYPFGQAECIDVHQAMRASTRDNAYLLFMEDKIGSIEKGKYADIAIWDKDWYKIPTSELPNENCEMTLVAGKIVYKADATPVTVSTLGKGL